VVGVAVLVVAGCAARFYSPPTGPGAPFAEADAVWRDLTARCRDARVFVAEMRVEGWVGSRDQGFAPVAIPTALTRANELYLEVSPAPGRPAVQMVGRAEQATLLLPRDERVLRAPTRDIIERLTGLRWEAVDMLNALTGCVATPPGAVTGVSYGNTAALDLGPNARMWVRRRGDTWQLEAATRDGLLLEYREWMGAFPSDVRVSATSADVTPLVLTFRLSQIRANIELDPRTFTLTGPDAFVPMTLEELRAVGPLRDGKGGQ
jgi:hypothetical protein